MPNEDVFQRDVSKSIDLLIFDAIQQVRLRNKRPGSLAIFKEISKAHATNFTQEDVKNRIEGLTNEKKLVNNKAAAGLDSFFVTSFVKETFTETDTERIIKLLSLYYKIKTTYQTWQQTFSYNNVNCNHLIQKNN